MIYIVFEDVVVSPIEDATEDESESSVAYPKNPLHKSKNMLEIFWPRLEKWRRSGCFLTEAMK